MGKTAFVFPGQGAQYLGMCKEFYEQSEDVRKIFAEASKASGIDVSNLVFNEEENLNITEYTQIALLTCEVAIMNEVMKRGVKPDVTAGLSLGEYAALSAANAMSHKDLFKLIRLRGKYMQEAYPEGGAMMAVLGLDAETVKRVCEVTEGIVSIANDNCPGQIVISGEKEAVAKAGESLAKNGAKRCIMLNVSGPFHSALLKGAGDKLAKALEEVNINDIEIPYICNLEARTVTDKNEVKNLLTGQVSGGVRFRESLLLMKEMGVDTFVEIGPGKTVSGFIKKIDRELKVFNVEKPEDIETLLSKIGR